jgi:hypothetical protein
MHRVKSKSEGEGTVRTSSVRLGLSPEASPSLMVGRAIKKNFAPAEMAVREGSMLQHKLVKSVKPCVEQRDSQMQKAIFAALKADLEKRFAAARAARQTQNDGGCGSDPQPIDFCGVQVDPLVPPTKIINLIFHPPFSPSASPATFSRLRTRMSFWAIAQDSLRSRYSRR